MYIDRYKNITFNNVQRVVEMFMLANYAKSVPPISVILGYYKVKVVQFCDDFNKVTKKMFPDKLPVKVKIYIYNDKTCKYIVEYPSINFLIKNLLKFKNKDTISYLDIYKLALIKKLDNPTADILSISKSIIATLFSMNIKIKN